MIRITGLFITVMWSRYLQCLYFFRRREPGAGDEVEADISQPGGAEFSGQRAQALRPFRVWQLWLRLRRAERHAG